MLSCLARLSTRTASTPFEARMTIPASTQSRRSRRVPLWRRVAIGFSVRRFYCTDRNGVNPATSPAGHRTYGCVLRLALRSRDFEGFSLNFHVVPEAGQPVDLGLAPEPGDLALCVLARRLLDLRHDGVKRARGRAGNVFSNLPVTQERKGFRIRRNSAMSQAAYFLHPARLEHSFNPAVNLRVELFAGRHQADFQNVEAGQPRSIAPPKLAGGLSSEKANFNGTNDLLRVAKGDLRGTCGIAFHKNAM